MARLNGILTKLQGSVGSFTFKQNGGQTVVSEKITQTRPTQRPMVSRNSV